MENNIKKNDKKVKKEKITKEAIDKQDIICYIGALFFLVMALLPIVLRNFDPNYDPSGPEEEKEVAPVIKQLDCNKKVPENGYTYSVKIQNTYKDTKIQLLNITYVISTDPTQNINVEEIIIPEYENISLLTSKGISSEKNGNTLTINIDFRKDETLLTNDALKGHIGQIIKQRQTYTDDGYTCNVGEGKL